MAGLTTIVRRLQANKNTRNVYYRVMAAQLSLGISLDTAVRTTARVMPKNPIARGFGARIDAVTAQGTKITDDWQKSGWLPPFDSAMLMLAEREGVQALGDAFATMIDETVEKITIFSSIIKPNLYPLSVGGIAGTFLWFFSGFLEQIAGRYPAVLEGQFAYGLSLNVQKWALPAAIAVLALFCLYMVATRTFTGTARKLIGFVAADHDMQTAKDYLNFSSKLAARGASFSEMTALINHAMNGMYVRYALRMLNGRLLRGDDYMLAVSVIVPPHLAQVLAGLAPAGERRLLPSAYRTVAIIIEEILRQRYTRMAVMMRTVMLSLDAAIVLVLVQGVYGVTTDLTNVIGQAR